MAVLAAALIGAALSLVLAIAAGFVIWQTGYRGAARTASGVVLAFAILAYPGWLARQALRRPWLADVSTDLAAPPPFSSTPQALAARHGSAHPEPPQGQRDAQRLAYPDVQPVVLDLEGDEAFKLVLKTVEQFRWKVIEAAAPKGRFGVGHIDAVARSPVMGLPEDVTFRLRPSGGQTHVDIRSASRFEPHDFGSNAARIEAVAEALQEAE